VLGSWVRHLTLTVHVRDNVTQVYKWVKPRDGVASHAIQGGVEILPVASCYRNRDKLAPDGPLGSYTDLTFFTVSNPPRTSG